jgi:hypothetical protein
VCEQVASHRSRFRPRKYKWRSVNEQAAALSHNNTERFSFFAEAKTKKKMLRATGHRVARHLLKQRRMGGVFGGRSTSCGASKSVSDGGAACSENLRWSRVLGFSKHQNGCRRGGSHCGCQAHNAGSFSSLTLSFFSLSLIANTRTQLWHPFAKYSLAKRSE